MGGILFNACTKDMEQVKIKKSEQVDSETTPEKIHAIISKTIPSMTLREVQDAMVPDNERASSCVCFNGQDLTRLLGCYGSGPILGNCACYDLNGDQYVNAQDLLILLGNFGNCPDFTDLDIAPWWNNFYNESGNGNPGYGENGWDLVPNVQGGSCSWNEIKVNCCVTWYINGNIVSYNKDMLDWYEAVQNNGMCSGGSEVKVRITHNPSGKIFERTGCSFVNLVGGWEALNIPDCSTTGTTCPQIGFNVPALIYSPFDPFEFCINCN